MSRRSYNRIDLAVEQLNAALDLFLNHRSYVSALTLAGAAEEVFGKALVLNGGTNSLQNQHGIVADLMNISLREYVDNANKARNALKHLDSLDDSAIDFDPEDAAVWMLVRACDNYNQLKREQTELMRRFEDWFWENFAGE